MYLQFAAGRMLVEAWGWGYLPCLLAVLVLCSVTLTWDAPLFAPYREHYVSQAHYHGVDVFTEALHSPVGPEQFMEQFYMCYGRDGRKTYFKKQDQNYFSNRRYWVISSSGKFVASMRTCWCSGHMLNNRSQITLEKSLDKSRNKIIPITNSGK